MRPRPYTPPPPVLGPVQCISLGGVYHALRHRGTAAMSGGGYRVALIRHLRRAV